MTSGSKNVTWHHWVIIVVIVLRISYIMVIALLISQVCPVCNQATYKCDIGQQRLGLGLW